MSSEKNVLQAGENVDDAVGDVHQAVLDGEVRQSCTGSGWLNDFRTIGLTIVAINLNWFSSSGPHSNSLGAAGCSSTTAPRI